MQSDTKWTFEMVANLIKAQESEGLTLEYKGAQSLDRGDGKKRIDFTIDISAMANSAGGVVIYGVAGYKERDKKHLPERIDPINRWEYSPEFIQQWANNIRPHIEGIKIEPIDVPEQDDSVLYVVQIPQSNTAHHALDKKYHKRLNATTEAMEDYEIRDVMARNKHPNLELEFRIIRTLFLPEGQKNNKYEIEIRCKNQGTVRADYVVCEIDFPAFALHSNELNDEDRKIANTDTPLGLRLKNTARDVVDGSMIGTHFYPKYGPARYEPILPTLEHTWTVRLRPRGIGDGDWAITWSLHTDNAPVRTGSILCKSIEIVEVEKEAKKESTYDLDE